jgi:RimJ/RimL family protein N-acetyltransferase
MIFKALIKEDMEQVRQWRNECLCALRTPFPLTEEMQQDFYKNVVCNRNANSRYWGIVEANILVGVSGIENIEWINSRGEISIIINPEHHGAGIGSYAFKMLLDKGFNELNLDNIWGECYSCNPATAFWKKQIVKYNGRSFLMPNAKFWNGKYYESLYFNFNREDFIKCR